MIAAVVVAQHPHNKELLPYLQPELPLFHFEPITAVPDGELFKE